MVFQTVMKRSLELIRCSKIPTAMATTTITINFPSMRAQAELSASANRARAFEVNRSSRFLGLSLLLTTWLLKVQKSG